MKILSFFLFSSYYPLFSDFIYILHVFLHSFRRRLIFVQKHVLAQTQAYLDAL